MRLHPRRRTGAHHLRPSATRRSASKYLNPLCDR
jgi:hypothetical protein